MLGKKFASLCSKSVLKPTPFYYATAKITNHNKFQTTTKRFYAKQKMDEEMTNEGEPEETSILLQCPFRKDSYEFLFEGSDENLLVEGKIDSQPVQDMQVAFRASMDSFLREIENYAFSKEEKFQFATEEAEAKKKIVDMWVKQGRTRQEMIELLKTGAGDKLVQKMLSFEYRGIEKVLGPDANPTLSTLQMRRMIIFGLYMNTIDVLRFFGLYEDASFFANKVMKILDTYKDNLDILSKAVVKYQRLKVELLRNNLSVENECFELFAELDQVDAYTREAYKALSNDPQRNDAVRTLLNAHIDLVYLLLENYVMLGKKDECIALLDRIMALKQDSTEQYHRPLLMAFKAMFLAYQGKKEDSTALLAEAKEARTAIDAKLLSINFYMDNMMRMSHGMTKYFNKEWIDMNVGADLASSLLQWLVEEPRLFTNGIIITILIPCFRYFARPSIDTIYHLDH